MLEHKLEKLFPSDVDREQARAILKELDEAVEGERVALAVLKLARSDLGEVRRCVAAALTDYRDIWRGPSIRGRCGSGRPLRLLSRRWRGGRMRRSTSGGWGSKLS